MKTNHELKAALNMVLARLESDPKTEAEWQTIRSALVTATAFAKERQSFWSPRCDKCGELHLFTDDVCKPVSRETLKAAMLAYEATGDHNHGSRSLSVGAACPGGDCNVFRARQLLLATDTFDAEQSAAAAKLVEFFEAETTAKVSP